MNGYDDPEYRRGGYDGPEPWIKLLTRTRTTTSGPRRRRWFIAGVALASRRCAQTRVIGVEPRIVLPLPPWRLGSPSSHTTTLADGLGRTYRRRQRLRVARAHTDEVVIVEE